MMQSSVQFILAFVVVLALIGLTAWLVRRFGGNRLGNAANRGRLPRLAVIDAAAVDGRRRLVLVRRDNVEHLLMIGGPSDIVVEPNIVRAMPGREQAPQRGGLGADLASRNAPAEAPSWATDSESSFEPEPVAPEPPPRPARPSFIEEQRRAVPPLPERRPDPVASFTPEPLTRPETPPRPEPRPEPVTPPARPLPRSEMPRSEPLMPRPMRADPPIRSMPPLRTAADRPSLTPSPPAPAAAAVTPPVVTPPVEAPAPAPTPAPAPSLSSADQNLADMAQRLEAALRRPSSEPRSEAPEPRIGAPSVAPEAPSRVRTPEISVAGPAAVRAEAPPVAPPIKTGFENLEDEMASLLGRPKSSS